ncbi:hypothetical protein BGW38_007848 [Lunasporangiospora selenospora]|uniref:Major facilitator superfamily (MFS) profile domain-containing protein n=1 Tax=Lunasporangiospora selenospora TaxID=979761 RepID=A0A9P6G0C0_9FUNG|nr:hypothetical protein BGW38_007848 [Lunasporangiospora selenospora]
MLAPSSTGDADPAMPQTPMKQQLSSEEIAAMSAFKRFCHRCQPLMLYVVSLAQFLDIVNGASMTVAMLPIAKELNFEVQQQQWLISSYALSFGGTYLPHMRSQQLLPTPDRMTCILLLIAGRMGDLFGHRRVFLIGLFWFGLFSLVNGFSKTPIMLCISRALQGIGAAGQARTRALSIFGAIGAMGAVTGLLLSGALTSTIGWQWIFYLSAIMSAILFFLGLVAIPDVPGLHGVSPKVDVGGAITATVGIVCVIYYITAGVEAGWAAAQTLPVLIVGIVLLVIFFIIEKRISYPIMPFHVWKHRAFSTSFVLIFIMQATFQGYLYYSTLIFQEVLGYHVMRTSLSYLVHGLTAIVAYSVLGRFLPQLPLKPFILAGFVCLAVSALLFSFVTPTSTYWVFPFLSLIVNVFGLGMVMLPAQITALRDADDDDQGVVGAIYNVGLQIGAPFGLAILTVISGKLNGQSHGPGGPERMYGYKYALLGDMSFALLGLVVTAIFLPNDKAPSKTEATSLEEGGMPAMAETEQDAATVIETEKIPPQKQEITEEHGLELGQKKEMMNEYYGKQELDSLSIVEEEGKAAAKVQLV